MQNSKQQVQGLDYQYRLYQENNESIPQGTQIRDYKVVKEIGRGAFGKIFLATNPKGKNFALKVMDLEKVRSEPNPKVKQIRWRLVQNEPKLMQQCNSPNVLKCFQIFESESLKILVLEYCNGKTLQEYLQQKIKINEEQAVKILRQIINGIAELHKHKIIHRDLKADNIMEHQGEYKIIDLGFSKKLQISHELAEVKGTILGTVTTMAPEVLSKQSYGLKADIWSIGVIFFQMIFGVMLYDSVSARQRLRQIEQKKYFHPDKILQYGGVELSKEANNFLFNVLQVNTEKRIGWRELVQHPLIAQKKQEPIGQRFLIRRDLQQPKVDLNLKVQPKDLSIGLIIQDATNQNSYKSSEPNIKEAPQKKEEPKNANLHDKPQIGLPRWVKDQPKVSDSAQFKWVKLGHLECLKTELIYNQIIVPIEWNRYLNLQERSVVQFMFLISARCFNNMSPISYKIQTQKNKENAMVKNLYAQTKDLYQKVYEKFTEYSNKLTKIENSYYQMFLDFFQKRFLKKNYQQKNSYTSGIQCFDLDQGQKKGKQYEKGEVQDHYGDYSKNQQIQYTYKNYVNSMIEKMSKLPSANKVRMYLRCYEKIMKVTLAELKQEVFADYVKRIIE